MPSKPSSASWVSATLAAMGCVVTIWSSRYANGLSTPLKRCHAALKRVASSRARKDMKVANDSLSHRSSHQRIVTRSPNHMWASSWSTTSARVRRSGSVGGSRNRKLSWNVTAPTFSIAPALNSGTNSWSYLLKGYGWSNSSA